MACTFCSAFNKAGCPTPNYCSYDFSREYHTQSTWTWPTSTPPVKIGPSAEDIRRREEEERQRQLLAQREQQRKQKEELRAAQQRSAQNKIGRLIHDHAEQYGENSDFKQLPQEALHEDEIARLIQSYKSIYGTAPKLIPIPPPPPPPPPPPKQPEIEFTDEQWQAIRNAVFFVGKSIAIGGLFGLSYYCADIAREPLADITFGLRTEFNQNLTKIGIKRRHEIGVVLGDENGQNPYIKRIRPNSDAQKAGLKVGYKILKIGRYDMINSDKKWTAQYISNDLNEDGHLTITVAVPNSGSWFSPDEKRYYYFKRPDSVEYKHSYQPQ